MSATRWRFINGFDYKYLISNYGDIYSLKRSRILKPFARKDGYLSITLGCGKKGMVKRFLVHRLVAEAFINNKNKLPQINHKDEDKTNNYVGNLEWCSGKYNCNYGTRNIRAKMNHDWVEFGKLFAKPVIQYDKNGNFIRRYDSARQIKRELGYDAGNIQDCCRGYNSHNRVRKSAYGYVWQYEGDE